MLKATVSDCHLAQRCPRLLARLRGGSGNAWKVGLDSSGDIPGQLFHDQFAAPFHKDMAAAFGKPGDSFAEILRGPAESLGDRISLFLRNQYFIPYLEKHSETLTADQAVGLAGCMTRWSAVMAVFLAPLVGDEKDTRAVVRRVFHPPERLLQAEHQYEDGERLTVSGRYDALLLDSSKGEAVVLDFKGRRPTDICEDFTQIVLYAWLIRESTGVVPRGMVLYLDGDGGTAEFPAAEIERGICQLPHLFDDVRQVVENRGPLRRAADAALCRVCPFDKACTDEPGVSVAVGKPLNPVAKQLDTKPPPLGKPIVNFQDQQEGKVALGRLCDLLDRVGLPSKPYGVIVGPRFLRLQIVPELEKGVTVGKLVNKAEDLQVALALKAPPLIQAQPGHISVDLPRSNREPLTLGALLETGVANRPASTCAFPLGMTIEGKVFWVDLAEPTMTSILIGGTSGSGKSVLLQSVVVGLGLCTPPGGVRFVLIDPKRVTFTQYAKFSCVENPLYLDIEPALARLKQLVEEMDDRYRLFENEGVSDVLSYASQTEKTICHYVVIIDEYADMILDRQMRNALEICIQRIGQKGRAAGFHLILATQRPDAKVVTGIIKANLQLKISLKVVSANNSRIILDEAGAEYLIGHGDMLVGGSTALERLQGPLVTKTELDQLALRQTR
ncbi:MAG: PD-(D/E)XK nuclease family protein [Planctomycetes bacterium]|nr:PD-(D/E)XK nuclease family protein [Planctomycetota bacterium]